MRLFHPDTVAAGRRRWGEKHSSLVVGWRFWLAGVGGVLAMWAYVEITKPDTANDTAKSAAKPSPSVANAAGEHAASSLPMWAIVGGLAVVLAIAAFAVIGRWGRSGRLERDVDRLAGRGANWGPDGDDPDDQEWRDSA